MRKILIYIFLMVTPKIAEPCSVPIYQYALENWAADDYRILVFQADSTASESALRALKAAAADSLLNFSLEIRPASELDTTNFPQKVTFPWLFAFYPKISRNPRLFWQGPLTPENVRQLTDSPIRRKLVQQIADGDAAVWLLLETGEPAADSARTRVIYESIEKFSKELKVAATSIDSLGNRVSHPDSAEISVRFSLMTLKANDPAESIFRRMLLGFEPDLFLLDHSLRQPVAVPVFGRGRALYSLIGPGINEKMIRRACESIIGWCSCEVKAENPGMDLLVKADWEKFVPQLPPPELPPLTGISRFFPVREDSAPTIKIPRADSVFSPKSAEIDSTVQDSVSIQIASTHSSPLLRSLLVLFLISFFGVLATTLLIIRRKHLE